MDIDFIQNGQASGPVANMLMNAGMDVRVLRPYIENNGRAYMSMTQNGEDIAVPVNNANATLRKDDWLLLDQAIVKAAKPRLRAVADLRQRGLEYNIPQGMGVSALQTQTQSDITGAQIDMDGITDAESDRPEFGINNLPLPIIHKDFSFTARQIMTSRNGGSPLDTSTAESAARRVAETAERLLLGTLPSYKYGGGEIFGYTNFPQRITKSLTDPTSSGWSPATTVQEVLDMKQRSQDRFHYGPWVLYTSSKWDSFLDDDYSQNKGDNTLRERIEKIDSIESVRTLDYLTDYQMVLVQMTSDVVREVIGMDIVTVQWQDGSGLKFNFKVMAIMTPQLRADFNGNTGIVHGSV